MLPDLQPIIEKTEIDVVIDHMGLVPADGYQHHRGFTALLALLDSNRVWVKVCDAYRVGTSKGPWDNVAPMARALIENRPNRIVWESDWPHTPPYERDAVDHRNLQNSIVCVKILIYNRYDLRLDGVAERT